MDTSHIYPKGRYKSLQFLPTNSKLLCVQCHFWWHENPVEAGKWVEHYLGPSRYKSLQERAREHILVNREFLEDTERKLKRWRDKLSTAWHYDRFSMTAYRNLQTIATGTLLNPSPDD